MSPAINFRTAINDKINDSLLPVLGKVRYVVDKTRPDILCTKAVDPPN
jgi:hypothetical protein